MKNYLFILSHQGAGSTLLSRILNSTDSISAISNSNITYTDIESLLLLNNQISLMTNFKPIYCDTLITNDQLYCKQLFNFCKFIFLLRPPEPVLKLGYSYNYLRFRLRRLYEYSKHTKNSICITYDDIISRKAFPLIEEFLNIKKPISNYYDPFPGDSNELASGKIQNINPPEIYVPQINSGKYERYLSKIRQNSKSII